MNELKHSKITVKVDEGIILDGIKNVDSFDETFVILSTNNGRINIEGKELKIESLSAESGEIFISGKISGFYYSEAQNAKTWFSKLFG